MVIGARTVGLLVLLTGLSLVVWRPHRPEDRSRPRPAVAIAPSAASSVTRRVATSPRRDSSSHSLEALASEGEIPLVLARALDRRDAEERRSAVEAAIRAWAVEDPAAAARWCRWQSEIPRPGATAALINGAVVHDPDAVVPWLTDLIASEPTKAEEYSRDLVHALGENERFEAAAEWALSIPEANVDLITAAYHQWAEHEPETALSSALALPDEMRRRAAADAAIGAWARTDPQAVVACAASFPPGPEKNLALVTALRAWAESDPTAAADWMRRHAATLAGVPRLETVAED